MQRTKNLFQCAVLCGDVYPGFSGENTDFVLETIDIVDERTDSHARAYILEDRIIIAIQGTKELADWKTNASVMKRSRYGVKMHRGYAIAAQALQSEINQIIAQYPNLQIYITGHSLGGAVAFGVALGVWDMLKAMRDDNRTVRLITYGQPKVASAGAIKRMVKFPYIRVVNGSDAVPRRPNIPGYYGHGGRLVYITNGGDLLQNPSWKIRMADRFGTFKQRLSDHSIQDYIEQLRMGTNHET